MSSEAEGSIPRRVRVMNALAGRIQAAAATDGVLAAVHAGRGRGRPRPATFGPFRRQRSAAKNVRCLDLQPPTSDRKLTGVKPSAAEPVERVDVLGGLIHEYRRAA